MRVLLDENMHVQLRHLFDEGVEAETVSTTLDFHPVADSNELSIAREKLEDVSEAVPATLQAGTVPPIAGDSQNKLLDCEF